MKKVLSSLLTICIISTMGLAINAEGTDTNRMPLPTDPVDELIENLSPDSYGGVYQDGDTLIIQVISKPAVKKSIAATKSTIGNIDFKQASYSMNQLKDAKELLLNRAEEFGITAVGFDEANNAVLVYLKDLSEDNQSAVTAVSPVKNITFRKGETITTLEPENQDSEQITDSSTSLDMDLNSAAPINPLPDNIIELANSCIEYPVRANPKAFGLSTRFGKSYISPNIPQYIYNNNEVQAYSGPPIYLLFFNENAVQFITNTSSYGGKRYPMLTEFLQANDEVCIIISGNKYFAKSKDDSFEIQEFKHLFEENQPEITTEDINQIKSDQITYIPLEKYFLKEYLPKPPKLRKNHK